MVIGCWPSDMRTSPSWEKLLSALTTYVEGDQPRSSLTDCCLQDSPLNGHIMPGDMITAVNDFAVGSNLHQDLWSQYFLEPNTIPASPSTGWCVGTEWFQGNYVILAGGRSLLTAPKPNQAPAVPAIHRTRTVLLVFHHCSVRLQISIAALTLYPS